MHRYNKYINIPPRDRLPFSTSKSFTEWKMKVRKSIWPSKALSSLGNLHYIARTESPSRQNPSWRGTNMEKFSRMKKRLLMRRMGEVGKNTSGDTGESSDLLLIFWMVSLILFFFDNFLPDLMLIHLQIEYVLEIANMVKLDPEIAGSKFLGKDIGKWREGLKNLEKTRRNRDKKRLGQSLNLRKIRPTIVDLTNERAPNEDEPVVVWSSAQIINYSSLLEYSITTKILVTVMVHTCTFCFFFACFLNNVCK